jgi:AAA+ ATPase superfamily predicted ATPase
MVSVRTEEFIRATSEVVYQKLLEGAIKNENLYVYGLRGIGKTTALIRFAKEFGYGVVIANGGLVNYFRDEFMYEDIYGEKSQMVRGISKPIVFDEGVDYKKLKKEGYDVITGFVLE